MPSSSGMLCVRWAAAGFLACRHLRRAEAEQLLDILARTDPTWEN